MKNRKYGQYSLVSYVHHLRGECVNVGVVIWHPRFGWRFPFSDDLRRISCIDREADIGRIQSELHVIQKMLMDWGASKDSPLAMLSTQFTHGLVVSEPLNARVVDIDFLSERLSSTLIAPPPAKKKRSAETILDRRFRSGFAAFAKESLLMNGILGKYNFKVRGGPDPIRIAAEFNYGGIQHIWRTMTFAKSYSYNAKLLRVKSANSENEEIKSMPAYKDAKLKIAFRVPPGDTDLQDPAIRRWVDRHSDGFRIFNRIPSIDAYDPDLIFS